MKIFLYSWVLLLVMIVFMDLVWFGMTIDSFYKPNLSHIVSSNFKYHVAVVFYILYSFGIAYLIIIPNFHLNSSVWQIMSAGFVMGFVTYSAYNLTNQATIENWPIVVTVIDTFWGTTLTATVSSITYKLIKLL